jgi:hypothetical protein
VREILAVPQTHLARAKKVATLSGLYDPADGRVLRAPLFRMLHDAGRFVYPVVDRGSGPGVLTGLDAVSDLEKRSQGLRLIGNINRRLVVWPTPDGPHVGRRIAPLHPRCTELVARDEAWYEVVALADALRLVPIRERARALELLQQYSAGAA